MVLQKPTVDTAVFEVARGGILREGLGYDRNDRRRRDQRHRRHLGLGGIDTWGSWQREGRVVEAVPRSGTAVLNADDHLVYRMGRHCAGRVGAVLDGQGEGRGRLRPRGRARVARQRGVLPRGHARGELIVLRHGPRKLPVLYTH